MQDARHRQTLCWMVIGILQSQNVHLSGFGVYVNSRAQKSQSHQRRFRRWLANRRIDSMGAHHALVAKALSQWGKGRLYLSLDTTVVWNCFCIVWVGVVYRGRTVPIAWKVVRQSSSTVRLRIIQRVLRQAQRVVPEEATVVLLADRGFADGKLMKYLSQTLAWHFRIRIKRSFQFYPTTLQTFAQYQLRFQVEESFLDLKSAGFNLEASRLQDPFALSQLCGVMALTTLFLVLQGTQVVASGQRQRVDPHWQRGMSYFKLGWNWIRLAITHQWHIQPLRFLSSLPDPQPAIASKQQLERSLERQFIVLRRFPSS